jgi:ATP-dependent Zn protease
MEQLARGTPGFSGAELFNLVNQVMLVTCHQAMMAFTMHYLLFFRVKFLFYQKKLKLKIY